MPVVEGAGTAGVPRPEVLTVQGATNGTPIPVSGAGGVSMDDEDTFVPGTTPGTPMMAVSDDGGTPDEVAAGTNAAVPALTRRRALHVNLRDAAGAEVAVAGGTQYDEDSAHSSGDKLTMAGVVRNDAATALAADGDRSVLQVDSAGALRVTGGGGGTQYTEDAAAAANPVGTALNLVRDDARGGSLTTTDGDNVAARGTNAGELYVKHVDAIPVTDNSSSLTVDGTVAVTHAALTELAGAIDTEMQVDVVGALPAGTNNIGDVDVLSVVPGTGATNLGKAEDAAHTSGDVGVMALSVRQDTAAALGQTDADYQPLITDASGRLHVNVGNTVTVGSHAVTNAGTFVVQENGAALTALQLIDDVVVADDAAFTPGTTKVAMVGAEFDDNTPDSVNEGDGGALRMSANRSLYVNVRDNAGNERGLNVDANGAIAATVTNATATNLKAEVVGTGTFAVQVSSLPASTNTIEVVGDAAHDAGVAGNPVRVGAYASASAPADVSGDGDTVNLWADRAGRLQVGDGGGSLTVDNAGLTELAAAIDTEVQVDVVGALPAGTNAIGKLAANSGVDIGDVDVTSISAGENHLGEVGGNSALISPSITASASPDYSAGDTIGGKLTLTDAMRVSGGSGLLQSVLVIDAANQKPALDIYIFDSDPSAGTYTDNAAVVFSTDLAKMIARIPVAAGDYVTNNSIAVAHVRNLGAVVEASGGDNLYAVVVTSSTPNLAATSDITIRFGFLRD